MINSSKYNDYQKKGMKVTVTFFIHLKDKNLRLKVF